jgi:ABC-type dipeptide/oligopeptide/nickel transport system permease subunit
MTSTIDIGASRRSLVWPWILALLLAHLPIVLAGSVAPHSPVEQYRDAAAHGPSSRFPLGTDDLGRDVASRLLHGARVSLAAGALATMLSLVIALVVGTLGAMGGSQTDAGLTTVTELTMAVPWVFLLLALRAALPLDVGPSTAFVLMVGLLGGIGWGTAARLVRGGVRQALGAAYVAAAYAAGASIGHVLTWHVWCRLRPIVAEQALLLLPRFILAEATLSFLSLGMPEPTPSLGTLIGELRSTDVLVAQPWRLAPPAALFVVTMGYNEVWERVRESTASEAIR